MYMKLCFTDLARILDFGGSFLNSCEFEELIKTPSPKLKFWKWNKMEELGESFRLQETPNVPYTLLCLSALNYWSVITVYRSNLMFILGL